MQQTCTQCSAEFGISDAQQKLYKTMEVPAPEICAACSEQLRFSFRNERTYYKRKCDHSGKDLISTFSPDSPYTVYEKDVWHSDAYNPLDYGLEPNFDRPVFDQIKDLSLAVPWEHMIIINSENCDYCNFVIDSKNCYLSVRVDAEDTHYSYLPIKCKDCVDCYSVTSCELCYECLFCFNSMQCNWCQYCKQCSNCSFCVDCIGCNNCFGCTGLRHKEFYIFNEPYSKEDYYKKLEELRLDSYSNAAAAQQKLQERLQQLPQRSAIIEKSENVTGDYIYNSKNTQGCFDCDTCEDTHESVGVEHGKDVSRSCFIYHGELTHELLSCVYTQNVQYTYGSYNSHDLMYCIMANGSHDCFGSVSLKQNEYLILNKQYTEEEYKDLRAKLIEYMKSTGEFGKFFPPELSPYAYNESFVQEYYPLNRQEALDKGYRWRDTEEEPPVATKTIPAAQLPDTIADIPDDVLNWSIECAESGKQFKMIKQELDFYRRQKLPVPRLHPTVRHQKRVDLRNPRKLWSRACNKCSKDIRTTYASDRPETVYCEECYLAEVY